MPFRRKRRRRFRRRRRRLARRMNQTKFRRNRFRGRNNINSMRVRGITGFPDQLVVKLKFAENRIYPTPMPTQSDVFAMNSIFDPTRQGGLSPPQPLGFDQWAQFYNQYEVRASKIIARVISPGSDEPYQMFIYPTQTSVALTTIDDITSLPYVKKKWVMNSNAYLQRPLVFYMPIRKFQGRSLDASDFSGTVLSDPAQVRFWQVGLFSATPGNIEGAIIDYVLIYYVRFFRRINVLVDA